MASIEYKSNSLYIYMIIFKSTHPVLIVIFNS